MTTGGDRTSGQLVAERIRHNVHRIVGRRAPEATLDRDLRALNAGWDFSSYVVPPAGGAPRRVVGLVRQLLLRLMYPLLQHESAWAGANTRIVNELVERLSAVQEELAGVYSSDTARGASVKTPGDSIAIDMFALEGAFRGTEEEIRRRQGRYVELFRGRTAILDVGCGRGEFLGLLLEEGIEASGVDHDPRMVEHCRAKGLDVTFDDAIHHLEQADDASLGGIFAAQLIEHLSPQALLALVSLSARKLGPGGALLLESPNPRSLSAVSAFYLDFTHVRPYHPEAVEWLMLEAGFEQVSIEESLPVVEMLDHLVLPTAVARREPVLAAAVENVARFLYGPVAYTAFGIRT